MGIFSRKPKPVACDMCGKTDLEGCGSVVNHIEQISGDQPPWLPAGLRAQAQGEYTWLCTRCNSYPAMKWPGDGGAAAGMQMHLGGKHYIGYMKGAAANFEMIPVRIP